MTFGFGSRLRRIREEKKLTRKELGKILSKSSSTIRDIENGVRTPPLETQARWEAVLGLSAGSLTHDIDESVGVALHEFREYVMTMNERDKRRTARVLRALIENDGISDH